MKARVRPLVALLSAVSIAQSAAAVTVDVDEDVMTSPFFTGADLVRGYPEDNRPTMRVSSEGAFGLQGAETIYLGFDYDFSSFTGPVNAVLTLQSVSGGFGADASAENPFTVSAHAVNADPFTSITDNTNPAGPIDWLSFHDNNIVDADQAARTVISGFGPVTFNVSAIVNGWVSGANSFQAIALTGKNDASGIDFLHGFLDNSLAPGSTFLTVTAVPEPETYALLLAGLGIVAWAARRNGGRVSASESAA